MKFQRIPNKLIFGRDRFYHVSSHKRKHEATKYSNKERKNGYMFRIIYRKNRYHIYRGQRKRARRNFYRKKRR